MLVFRQNLKHLLVGNKMLIMTHHTQEHSKFWCNSFTFFLAQCVSHLRDWDAHYCNKLGGIKKFTTEILVSMLTLIMDLLLTWGVHRTVISMLASVYSMQSQKQYCIRSTCYQENRCKVCKTTGTCVNCLHVCVWDSFKQESFHESSEGFAL